MAVAVKKSNPDSIQGLEEWQSEVKFLGKFSHPNLVKLLGYCWEEKQFLLVYEYMQKGSLENHLFRKGAEPLPWDVRLRVSIGAAQGLAFLHTSEKSVIYRDFKTSNILLDGDYNAKLSDFGLAKLGPINGNSHITTRVMGTYGYAAPEYVATGEHNLVDWAKPSLSDKRKLKKIMDPRLEEQYPIKGALQTAELIINCLEADPRNRPSMEKVLESLEKIYAIREKPKESKVKNKKQGNNRRQEQNSAYPHRSPLHSKHGGSGNGGSAYPVGSA
ncbi:hypothetical protein GH714_016808 [Hevea brasiliensis]|uniref:non-specific serine/threonine protein kinase n=1 Tax=Hevea brasiliensis TaxID=3981 RepID=A0A6A6NI59_HEVBR|nr:hypothetical protein GH714_016808 [Hevea brasiliensis]